jgi:hypothetical protein
MEVASYEFRPNSEMFRLRAVCIQKMLLAIKLFKMKAASYELLSNAQLWPLEAVYIRNLLLGLQNVKLIALEGTRRQTDRTIP